MKQTKNANKNKQTNKTPDSICPIMRYEFYLLLTTL